MKDKVPVEVEEAVSEANLSHPDHIRCGLGERATIVFEGQQEVVSAGILPGRKRRLLNFTAQGPSHMGLYIQPCLEGGGTKITKWNFGAAPKLNKLDAIWLYIGSGSLTQTWPVSIEIEEDVTLSAACPGGSSIGIALAGR
jgi:hypothetical protein